MSREMDRSVFLLNDAVLHLPGETVAIPARAEVFIAGRSKLRLMLANLILPEARIIWTDFRQSASLSALHGAIQAVGGLDRLVLGGDGEQEDAMFSLMQATLTLLPALRRKPSSRIELHVEDGRAVSSLKLFIAGISQRLTEDGIVMSLKILEPRADKVAA